MTITYYPDVDQGSDEWFAMRCGIVTAGSTGLLVTPTGKRASNDKERSHMWELMAQRITGYVEPSYVGDDMLRGIQDEITARDLYSEQYAPVEQVGIVINDDHGFKFGYSPDGLVGLVGDDGQIEVKSRRQKYQIETLTTMIMPDEHKWQVQAGLMVTGRAWCDFVSFSAGLPMVTIRQFPDPEMQTIIMDAIVHFENRVREKIAEYEAALKSGARLIPTERKIEQEMFA